MAHGLASKLAPILAMRRTGPLNKLLWYPVPKALCIGARLPQASPTDPSWMTWSGVCGTFLVAHYGAQVEGKGGCQRIQGQAREASTVVFTENNVFNQWRSTQRTVSVLFINKHFRWTPHPVIVTTRDSGDYIRVLLYFHYTTIAAWGGVHLANTLFKLDVRFSVQVYPFLTYAFVESLPEPQRVHVGRSYRLRAQMGPHLRTLRPKHIPYSYMDLLGMQRPTSPITLKPRLSYLRTSKGPALSTVYTRERGFI